MGGHNGNDDHERHDKQWHNQRSGAAVEWASHSGQPPPLTPRRATAVEVLVTVVGLPMTRRHNPLRR